MDIPTPLEDWRSLVDCHDESVTIKDIVCGAKDTALLLSDGRCYVTGENKIKDLAAGTI